jgi:hypothetical protein
MAEEHASKSAWAPGLRARGGSRSYRVRCWPNAICRAGCRASDFAQAEEPRCSTSPSAAPRRPGGRRAQSSGRRRLRTSGFGPNAKRQAGQSMSALPGDFRRQLVPQSKADRRLLWLLVFAVLGTLAAGIYLAPSPTRESFPSIPPNLMAFPLPPKPSIAVLPFNIDSSDQTDVLIGRGLASGVRQRLSKAGRSVYNRRALLLPA